LKVVVRHATDGKGLVYVSLFDNENDFLRRPRQVLSCTPKDGTCSVSFTFLPSGAHAVAAYQDVNGNRKLDRNFIGIPKEPSAMSNDAKGKYGPPKWRDAKFQLQPEISITLP
jgi:uncharacterized protein (DUF2141 family)